jgi:hypothetical protein
MRKYDIVAFYRSRELAERVRDELLDAGFVGGDIKLYQISGGVPESLWDDIKASVGGLSDEDRAIYVEAGRRGSVGVGVSLDDADGPQAEIAIEALCAHQPLDLERQGRPGEFRPAPECVRTHAREASVRRQRTAA